MNFLKSIQSTFIGPSIPYTILSDNDNNSNNSSSIWRINPGLRKSDGLQVTVFQYDKTTTRGSNDLSKVQNARSASRSLRLPALVKVYDVLEDGEISYIVTERITPLSQYLAQTGDKITDSIKVLILYQVLQGLKYLNVEGASVLGKLSLDDNIYVDNEGGFKIGGFELLAPMSNPGDKKIDSQLFGTFIFKLFNDPENKKREIGKSDLASGSNVPEFLMGEYKKLISSSLTLRPSIEQLWSKDIFSSQEIIQTYRRFEEYSFQTSAEDKYHTLLATAQQIDKFPRNYQENKILPELLKYYEANPTNVDILSLILHQLKTSEAIPLLIKPTIFKSFQVPDRQIRLLLLTYLPQIIPHLSKSEINDIIFPQYITGFQDSHIKIRTESLKQLSNMVPQLYHRQLNNECLRILAKLQSDDFKEIRTLTTITLATIASHLDPSTRASVLAIAFTKSLKDFDIPNKTAALLAVIYCLDIFTPEIIANKVLTVIAPALLDTDGEVRKLAKRVFKVFVECVYSEMDKLEGDSQTQDQDSELKLVEQDLREQFESLCSQLEPLQPEPPAFVSEINRTSTVKSQVKQRAEKVQDPVQGGFKLDHAIQSNDSLVNFITEATATKPVKAAPPTVRPKVTRLSTEPGSNKPKTRLGSGTGGLKLQPKKTLQKKKVLSLDPVDDEDDGWGEDNW